MPSTDRKNLIISNHSLLRVYQNKMTEEMVQKLYRKAKKVSIGQTMNFCKFIKYGNSQLTASYYWADGFLLTVNSKTNCLITIHRQPRFTVKFEQ